MKLKLKIMNIIYFVISAVAVFFLLANPLYKSHIKCHVDYQTISETVDDDTFETLGVTKEELFAGNPELDLDFEIKVTIGTALSSFGKSSEEFVNENLVGKMINSLVEDVQEPLEKIGENAINTVSLNIFEDELKGLVGQNDNLYAKLGEKGITKANVQESVNKFIASGLLEGKILSQVADSFMNEFQGYCEKFDTTLKDKNHYMLAFEVPLHSAGIIDDFGEVVSVDDTAIYILQSFMSEYDEEELEDEGEDEGEAENPYGENELANKLIKFVDNNYFPKTSDYTRIHLFCIMGVLLLALLVAGWVIKMVRVIICLFRKTPYLRISPYGIVSGIIQVGFCIVSLVSIIFFAIGPVAMTRVPVFGGVFSSLPALASYSIVFSAFIPGFLVIGNGLLSLVYGPVKNRFKAETKKEAESFLDIE